MLEKPLTVQLGEFVAALRFEDLPPAVVDKAKALVNHAVTVAMASYSTTRVEAARRAVLLNEGFGARRIGTGQGATLWVDGTRVTGEYHGRELMWDFAKDAQILRRFVPGLPITPAQYDRLVATIASLDTAVSVDQLVRLTLPEA